MLQVMSSSGIPETSVLSRGKGKGARSHSAQSLWTCITSPTIKIPLPPRMWLTDVEDESSDDIDGSVKDDGVLTIERAKVRSRYRHQKQRTVHSPIGIFWDIENCQVPRGCSAIDVVTAIRAKFLPGKREADFVVVCDVRKESAFRLQELNDAQVSLIHVCGTQKNAADEKLRQCMRRFAELHKSPASLLLISGDINFASDLSDFRHRKNMEVILVHKQNTSSALITCASSHYCYNELTADLPRNPKRISQSNEEDEDATCVLEVLNLPTDQSTERVSRRLRRLADNCGGKVIRVTATTALLKFQTLDHSSRALKRMDGEDVFGRKITTRFARSVLQPTYSSDEGYGTATATVPAQRGSAQPPSHQAPPPENLDKMDSTAASRDWARALKLLPAPTPAPLEFCPPPAPKPRKIRGTHGSVNLDQSGCSSSNSGDDSRHRDGSQTRAISPWNSSASMSEQSDGESECLAELTVSNLPLYDTAVLQDMLVRYFSQYVPVIRASVWTGSDGPLATIVLRSEADARLAIARVHKRRLDNNWMGRRLDLSLGKPSPAPNLDVLRARLRAILLDQRNYTLPLVRLRDAYANRHCCALTTADIAKVKDTVVIHENYGRVVQLIDLTPVTSSQMEEAPWKCHIHASLSTGQEDGSRILQPVYMEVAALAANVKVLLESHNGVIPLLSFVECYEASFPPLLCDVRRGVALELLLRNAPEFEVKDMPSRHLTWRTPATDASPDQTCHSDWSRSSNERERGRTAPALEPMLSLFERELVDLLRTTHRCSIPFSKLIPAFHHHYGRQCRVADYGFTRLPDLLLALNSIVVLGSGSSRIITLSAATQSRRWTADLVKLLKAAPGRSISPNDLPMLYQSTFGRRFTPIDYGVCTLAELMQRVNPQTVVLSPEGFASLPRRSPTPGERARTFQFAAQVVELLSYTANLRMEFSRFVPSYHAHFGRQLRVAHYGCVKLVELFELIPDAVNVYAEASGERSVRLTATAARPIIAQRLLNLTPVPLVALPAQYAKHFGSPPLPDILEADCLEALVYGAGGYVDGDMTFGPGQVPQWSTSMLCVCAVLSADRCVSRGSSAEYMTVACRRLGLEVDLRRLLMAGVVEMADQCVRLTSEWRLVWRVAQILENHAGPLTPLAIIEQYKRCYEPDFPPAQHGLDGVFQFLRRHREVFVETIGHWELCTEIKVPKCQDLPGAYPCDDYSLFNTPPGQKGSRVFESPKNNMWISPPANTLPAPTALLPQEPKRRTRLAAQFDTA